MPEQSRRVAERGFFPHAADAAYEPGHRSVATFTLASTGVLARVVRDHRTGLYRISVLSEDPEHRRYVLVGVRGPCGQTPLEATDSHGLAMMSLGNAGDWTSMYVVVITPSASLTLPEGLPISGTISSGTLSIGLELHQAAVQVRLISGPGERIGHAVAVLRDGSAVLRDVSDNQVLFDPSTAGSATELRFFL